jgi:DNA primase
MLRSLGVLLAEGLEVVVVDLPPGDDPDTLLRNGGVAAWEAARAHAYDPVLFIQRHVLRASSAGDPRERALQSLVPFAADVRDPVRVRLLLERGSQVFGLGEAVLARAVALKRTGQGAEAPIRAAVREQRRGESDVEHGLLRALLQAPDALRAARERLSPEDFRDDDCRALAMWLWSGSDGLPVDGPAAGLARGLLASSREGFNWAAEADGGVRRMVERRLKQRMKECRNRLSNAAGGPEAEELMHEIDDIARSLRELNA